MIDHLKFKSLVFFAFFTAPFMPPIFPQEGDASNNSNELLVSEQDLIILFSSFVAAVIAIFLYLSRHQILRKKLPYDAGDYESKKNKDYEKYHSEWTSDAFVGEKSINKDDEEFRKSLQNSNLPDYYKILGITKDATQEEIKNQFRRLVKEWHPDRNPDPETKEKMSEINKAYEVLADQNRRKNYDKFYHFS